MKTYYEIIIKTYENYCIEPIDIVHFEREFSSDILAVLKTIHVLKNLIHDEKDYDFTYHVKVNYYYDDECFSVLDMIADKNKEVI